MHAHCKVKQRRSEKGGGDARAEEEGRREEVKHKGGGEWNEDNASHGGHERESEKEKEETPQVGGMTQGKGAPGLRLSAALAPPPPSTCPSRLLPRRRHGGEGRAAQDLETSALHRGDKTMTT